jgi:predicted membrane chloride channel (bestrophin family)
LLAGRASIPGESGTPVLAAVALVAVAVPALVHIVRGTLRESFRAGAGESASQRSVHARKRWRQPMRPHRAMRRRARVWVLGDSRGTRHRAALLLALVAIALVMLFQGLTD